MRQYTRGPLNHMWKGGRTKHQLGYVMIWCPDHPRAHVAGYVFEHILVAEHAIGHHLPVKAQVHHVNEKKDENRGSNLVICEDQKYHALLHHRMRALRATGSATARQCVFCKEWNMADDPIANMSFNSHSWRHRSCSAAYERKRLAHTRSFLRGPRQNLAKACWQEKRP